MGKHGCYRLLLGLAECILTPCTARCRHPYSEAMSVLGFPRLMLGIPVLSTWKRGGGCWWVGGRAREGLPGQATSQSLCARPLSDGPSGNGVDLAAVCWSVFLICRLDCLLLSKEARLVKSAPGRLWGGLSSMARGPHCLPLPHCASQPLWASGSEQFLMLFCHLFHLL